MGASFADLVPLRESVKIRGRDFEVQGLEITDLGQLFFRFPELEAAIRKGNIAADDLLTLSSKTLSAIIAAGAGKLGDKEEEKGIACLSLGEKASMIGAIWNVTMPDGPGPFVDLARRLARGQIVAAENVPPASVADSSSSSQPSRSD